MYHSDYSMENNVSNFMYKVYGWMAVGLSLTAFLAYYLSTIPTFVYGLLRHPFGFIGIFIVQLGLVFALSMFVLRMSYATALFCFLLYAASVSLTLSTIFLVYPLGSIYLAFGVTAGMFAVMCLYGYFTKADLSSMGSLMTMALFGLIIASVVNMFLQSPAMDYVLSIIGVGIFTMLTAYDTQKLKRMAQQLMTDEETKSKMAIVGALTLYLDFLNLFLFLLRLLNNRRD